MHSRGLLGVASCCLDSWDHNLIHFKGDSSDLKITLLVSLSQLISAVTSSSPPVVVLFVLLLRVTSPCTNGELKHIRSDLSDWNQWICNKQQPQQDRRRTRRMKISQFHLFQPQLKTTSSPLLPVSTQNTKLLLYLEPNPPPRRLAGWLRWSV